MKKKEHYQKQLKYFGDEFGQVKEYHLASWQESYIKRIKKDLLGKNYKSKTLIDVATGTGYVAIEMAKLGMKVIATDLTPEAIENLKKYKKKFKLSNLTLKKSLAEKIDLPDNSVDYLVANAILEHIPEEQKAIEEWKRIVKPGGKLFITVPLKFRYIWPFLWLPNHFHDKRIGHLRRYDYKDLQKKFNLPVENHYYSGHIIKILGIIVGILTKSSRFDGKFEELDRKGEKIFYGGNNISIVLKNTKISKTRGVR